MLLVYFLALGVTARLECHLSSTVETQRLHAAPSAEWLIRTPQAHKHTWTYDQTQARAERHTQTKCVVFDQLLSHNMCMRILSDKFRTVWLPTWSSTRSGSYLSRSPSFESFLSVLDDFRRLFPRIVLWGNWTLPLWGVSGNWRDVPPWNVM